MGLMRHGAGETICGSGRRQACAAVFTPKNSLEKNLRQWWCLSVPTMFAGREKTAKNRSVSPWVLLILTDRA